MVAAIAAATVFFAIRPVLPRVTDEIHQRLQTARCIHLSRNPIFLLQQVHWLPAAESMTPPTPIARCTWQVPRLRDRTR
ncbi:hypothetical protein ABQ137_00585 [Xanthomonas sp. WHRI 8393]|uniref:hypothetical protein n=1 Tax=Xanthomonas sp. WHRI 8393 TaxID=3161574 RepID=UPI0032E8F012